MTAPAIETPAQWLTFWATFAATTLVLTAALGLIWWATRPATTYRKATR